jgi:chromate transporter
MIILRLFLSFFKVGLFAIGGAYSFLPLMEKEVVHYHHWLDKSEFLDVLGIVKIFPGAISIKFATYTGYKVAGVPGVIAANLGNLLAPVVLILFATYLYSRYKDRPGVTASFAMIQYAIFAMIIAVAFQLVDRSHLLEPKYVAVVAVSFVLFAFTRVHPALIIIGAGVVGALLG